MLRPSALRTHVRLLAAPAVVLALLAALLSTPPTASAASAPSVTKINVTSGPLKGGTVVVITGKNFSKLTSVKFGDRTAKYKLNSTTKITATSPSHNAGTVDVRVAGRSGRSRVVAAGRFGYVAAPTVTSLAPASGTELGGTAVTVTGTNFRTVRGVTIGGVKAAKVSVVSATKLIATATKHIPGSVDVKVITAYGTSAATTRGRFGYLSVPTVTTATLPVASAGVRYVVQVAGAKGAAPYRWSATGLPAGLNLSSTGALTGMITNVPSRPTTSTVTVQITDAKNLTTRRTLGLTVQSNRPGSPSPDRR